MGGLSISNKEFRCENCFQLFKMKIKPLPPETKIILTCICEHPKESILHNFIKEVQKEKSFVLKCSICKNVTNKKSIYCYDCLKVYCTKCQKKHEENFIKEDTPKNKDLTDEKLEENSNTDNKKNDFIPHKIISTEKVDFYCSIHQEQTFIAYCNKCKINICQVCIKENLHNGHNFELFEKKILSKKEKEYLKENIKFALLKIDYNSRVSKMVKSKAKKELRKEIEDLSIANDTDNRSILDFIKIVLDIYENLKEKNITTINNLTDNIHFDINRLKFPKQTTAEEDAQLLINYLKSNWILDANNDKNSKGNSKGKNSNLNDLEKNKVGHTKYGVFEINEAELLVNTDKVMNIPLPESVSIIEKKPVTQKKKKKSRPKFAPES